MISAHIFTTTEQQSTLFPGNISQRLLLMGSYSEAWRIFIRRFFLCVFTVAYICFQYHRWKKNSRKINIGNRRLSNFRYQCFKCRWGSMLLLGWSSQRIIWHVSAEASPCILVWHKESHGFVLSSCCFVQLLSLYRKLVRAPQGKVFSSGIYSLFSNVLMMSISLEIWKFVIRIRQWQQFRRKNDEND